MSNWERVSYILGTLLVGIAAFIVVSGRRSDRKGRRSIEPPVEELAEHLKQAWAGHHIR